MAFVLVVALIGGALGGGDSGGSGGGNRHHGGSAHGAAKQRSHAPATYVVKSGDTLVAIAHEFGVPVARIVELNPEVDPQILIAGETLKLR
ncbi:MAG: LysM peptidoglycan-binding domain-containing protein [Solirubrobacterales bacterium]